MQKSFPDAVIETLKGQMRSEDLAYDASLSSLTITDKQLQNHQYFQGLGRFTQKSIDRCLFAK